MNNVPFPWTDDLVELAFKCWAAGQSAGEIATLLGEPFTRSSVIGKVHRAGLNRSRPLSMTPRAQKARGEITVRPAKISSLKRKIKPTPRPKPQPVVLAPVISLENARPWLERASRECAYLLDDGRSCCMPTPGRADSYCAGHKAMIYRPTARMEADKMARKYG